MNEERTIGKRKEQKKRSKITDMMAFIVLPTLCVRPTSVVQIQSKDNKPLISHSQVVVSLSSPKPYSSTLFSPLTKLGPPPVRVAQLNQAPPSAHDNKQQQQRRNNDHNDFYVNLGLAVRTLREDLPLLFSKDLNYDIYREDITFVDPLNTFTGIENYKLIFWALRFHGRILFREISLEVLRVWQPSENVILIRWNLRGVPRVPWEAKGQFQGTSRYKLDRNGKIYQHKVDNLAFNFPQPLKPAASVLDLVVACPASPNPTFLWGGSTYPPTDAYYSCSWVELYRAVREAVNHEASLIAQDCLVTCS